MSRHLAHCCDVEVEVQGDDISPRKAASSAPNLVCSAPFSCLGEAFHRHHPTLLKNGLMRSFAQYAVGSDFHLQQMRFTATVPVGFSRNNAYDDTVRLLHSYVISGLSLDLLYALLY